MDIKRKLAVALLSATCLTSAALAKDSDKAVTIDKGGKVVATYNGGKVTESQIIEQIKPYLEQQEEKVKNQKFSDLDKKTQEMLVRGYVNIQLIEKEAQKSGITKTKEFKAKVKSYEHQLMQELLVQRHLKDAITDKMIDDEYQKLVKERKGAEEIEVAHILVENEDTAKEIKKKLNKGADFAKLVQESSKDEKSKATGGTIGYILKGQVVPAFEEKAFTMKVNEISDPVKTDFGWHIIKVLDKRKATVPTKEQATPNIESKLAQEIITKYFKELNDKANVKIMLDK